MSGAKRPWAFWTGWRCRWWRCQIQAAALGAFNAVGGRDYARVDVMVRADGSPVVLEVNTLPGMTETSLLPKAAAVIGLDYAGLCQRMVDLALRRKELILN